MKHQRFFQANTKQDNPFAHLPFGNRRSVGVGAYAYDAKFTQRQSAKQEIFFNVIKAKLQSDREYPSLYEMEGDEDKPEARA